MTAALPPLISAADLQNLLASGAPVLLLDCGFDLADPAAGEHAYAAGHLPGALYAHLDRDLSGAKAKPTDALGRHPLPQRAAFADTAATWGLAPGLRVVTYDAQGGPYAARAWWLLRWLGHAEVQVLDGGVAAWQAHGGTLNTQTTTPPSATAPYPADGPAGMPTLNADALQARLGQVLLLDARAAERFRGDVEPLDPVAGHIPGATNRFFKHNLQTDGRFKPAPDLRSEFYALGNGAVVHQCGSGVTACHNLLAMAVAGLDAGALYPGSWSGWCADPARPVARG
jgi:thiosulfate/3-mercaptopyruvate sulfurtransferase